MTTEEQIISEVKNTFKQYAESNLIDEITLRDVLKSELKSFGSNVMVVSDEIITVKNGKAELPSDFWSLKEAWKYKPSYYEVTEGSSEELEKSGYWRTRVIQNGFEDDCSSKPNTTIIKEEFHYKESSANIYFAYPSPLRLRPGFKSNIAAKDCKSLPKYVKRTNKNEINIVGNYLQTEFSNGFVYIVYRALPTDETKNIIIPETQHDKLYRYLRTVLEYTVARQIWLNGDDPNIANKISFLLQEKEDLRSQAMTELKAKVLDPAVWKTIRNSNRKRYQKYSGVIPKQDFRR